MPVETRLEITNHRDRYIAIDTSDAYATSFQLCDVDAVIDNQRLYVWRGAGRTWQLSAYSDKPMPRDWGHRKNQWRARHQSFDSARKEAIRVLILVADNERKP